MKLLVCIKDNKTGSVYDWTKRPQAGDVIAVGDDLDTAIQQNTNPNWRIFNLPNQQFLDPALLMREVPVSLHGFTWPNTLQFRMYKIDVSGLALTLASLRTYLGDNTRASPVITLSQTIPALGVLGPIQILLKPPVVDPHTTPEVVIIP